MAFDRPKTVLVVEDDVTLLRLLVRILSSRGYHVIAAANGIEALSLSITPPPDLVVTDVTMPGLSGPAMIERMRSAGQEPTTIYISGQPAEVLRYEGFAPGENFLPKPFTPFALRAQVAAALAGSHPKPGSSSNSYD